MPTPVNKATKPSLPSGTRDFAPDIVRKRNYIFNTIRQVFELEDFGPADISPELRASEERLRAELESRQKKA